MVAEPFLLSAAFADRYCLLSFLVFLLMLDYLFVVFVTVDDGADKDLFGRFIDCVDYPVLALVHPVPCQTFVIEVHQLFRILRGGVPS